MRHYLIVDDNLEHADNLAEILRDCGDEVDVCGGGLEALVLAGSRRYDALITDMRMPVMDGARLVHEIRRVDPGLPALLSSAYTSVEDLQSARREGLLAVLPKPVPVQRLLSLLGSARRGGLVAIVEDDLQLCDALSEALAGAGFTAVCAHSLAETVGLPDPFAAVVDLRVPGGPAGAAAAVLRARWPDLPIAVMTGHDDDAPESPWPVFHKPFDVGRLLGALGEAHQHTHGGARA